MLALLFFSILLLAPVLQGIWGYRTQFLFQAACLSAGGLWALGRAFAGRLPRPEPREWVPLAGAAFFSLLGAVLGPLRGVAMGDWWGFFFGLFTLAFAGLLDEDGRRRADRGLRLAAWALAALSLYQAFSPGGSDISATLTNPNALALFALMLIPAAAAWRDYFLVVALVIILIWTQSMAALLALLAAAGVYTADNAGKSDFRKNWPLYAVLAAAAVVALWQLDPRSVLDRLGWWKAAARMAADAPLLGFGHGAFAWLYPAYHRPEAAGLSSVYVHNYYLEFLAENGALAALCWFWAVFARARAVTGLRRYAVIAALVHSAVDFGLAVPANLYVFCYLLASPRDEERAGDRYPAVSGRAAACALLLAALALAHALGRLSAGSSLEKAYAGARAAHDAGRHAEAAALLEGAAADAPDNPLLPRLQGQALLAAGLAGKDRELLFRSAAALERSLLLNPYNSGAYRDLEYLYGLAGASRLKADLLERRKKHFRWE